MKIKNPKKIIIGHLNINSIRWKFDFLKEIISNNIDILLLSETKIDNTFTVDQFNINGYHPPFRADRNKRGGVLPFYFRDHIPCKQIMWDFLPGIEVLIVELNLKKRIN